MSEIWIEMTHVTYSDNRPRLHRRLVSWDNVVALEETSRKTNKEVKTIVFVANGDDFGVTDTLDDIIDRVGLVTQGNIGFGRKE